MQIRYQGSAFDLYKISIKNLLFYIVTFGIYYFWAKTNLRKYIYSQINIEGDNLEYSGTGNELFRGYIKAILFIFAFSLITTIITVLFLDKKTFLIANFIIAIAIFGIMFYSRYLAIRYRLNKTRWRSIRTHLSGSAKDFAIFKFKRIILDIISFGILSSRSKIYTRAYYINNISIGSMKFSFDGRAHFLDKIHIITLLLAPFTFFLSRIWYIAALKNYLWQSTKIGPLNFATSFSVKKIFKLYFGNFLILIFTFGLGFPFIVNRNIRFLTNNLTIIGNKNQVNLLQSYYDSTSFGEGVSEIMDDSDFGFDFGIL